MRVCLTVDVEQDCPPYWSSYRGIEEGLPRLLNLLAEEQLRATFFTTGDVARRYPAAVQELVAAGHELGCHGDTHRGFDTMTAAEAEAEIQASLQTLRQLAPVVSFRAPNLNLPGEFLPLLAAAGIELDSSQGRHRIAHWLSRQLASPIARMPASTTSSALRLPRLLRAACFWPLADPVVLFVHPWEFVDLRQSRLRWDCRFRTGQQALDCLKSTIAHFRNRGGEFLTMAELLPAAQPAGC